MSFKSSVKKADNDRELIEECVAGSNKAWDELYSKHKQLVYKVCHWDRWHFNFDDAEDLVQEVFISLKDSLKRFNYESSLDTFISNLAKKRCISRLRHLTAQKRGSGAIHASIDQVDPDTDQPVIVVADPNPGPAAVLEEKETKEELIHALEDIGEPCKEIIIMKYYGDLSYEDISGKLGVAVGTVGSRLKRCILRLRELLKKNQNNRE
jgi:RNA polymerase sigma-70 factor, ECF subfamily